MVCVQEIGLLPLSRIHLSIRVVPLEFALPMASLFLSCLHISGQRPVQSLFSHKSIARRLLRFRLSEGGSGLHHGRPFVHTALPVFRC